MPGTIFEALYVRSLIKPLLCPGKAGIVILILSRGRPKFRKQTARDLMAGWVMELGLDPGVENVDAYSANSGGGRGGGRPRAAQSCAGHGCAAHVCYVCQRTEHVCRRM